MENYMFPRRLVFILCLVIFGLLAWSLVNKVDLQPGELTALPFKGNGNPSNSPSPTPTLGPTEEPCSFVWASYTLDDVTASFQKTLKDQNLPFDPERTRAYAFGEDCVTTSGTNKGFGAMETDFSVMRVVKKGETPAALGEYAKNVLAIIVQNFIAGENTPGLHNGFVEFVFVINGLETYQRVPIDDAAQALELGINGEAFYQQFFPTPSP
jgi:hypothetical protein